jgi:glycosyltransferase involved in cell wall biosynthesis
MRFHLSIWRLFFKHACGSYGMRAIGFNAFEPRQHGHKLAQNRVSSLWTGLTVHSDLGPCMIACRLRVLSLGRSFETGGAERQLGMAAEALALRGHEVTLATLYNRGTVPLSLSRAGVKRVSLEKSGRYDLVGAVKRFLRLVQAVAPDIVYAHLPVQNLLALSSRAIYPYPTVVWGLRSAGMTSMYYDRLSSLAYRLESLASGMPDWIVANSHAGKRFAIQQGFPSDRLSVIPNGIDLDRFRPDTAARAAYRSAWDIADGTFVIGHVGRLDPMKGHASFLEALATAFPQNQAIRVICIVAGSPMKREYLLQSVGCRGLSSRVHVVETCTDIAGAYSGFDLFCSSSAYGEGFSNVTAEALACGVPCVVTDVGDARKIVGETGIVVPPACPDALANALAVMYERYRNGQLPSAALLRARVLGYGPSVLGTSLEELFLQLVTSRRP